MWMMDEAAALEAFAATEEPASASLAQGEGARSSSLLGFCSKKKKSKSQSKTIPISPSVIERDVDGGKIVANLNQRGEVTASVFYTKKSRCGIPYAVKVDRVDIKGRLDLPGSELTYTGTVKNERNFPVRLFDISSYLSFYVGFVRIVVVPSVRGDANVKLSSELQVTAGVRTAFNAVYSFDYTCTKAGCIENVPFESSVETAPDPGQLIGSVSACLTLKPSINLAARIDGSLYIRKLRFFRAEVGLNLAIPAELWLYAGNACGDANGDGVNEFVKGALFDVSAEVYSYGEFSAFGLNKTRAFELSKLSAPWVKGPPRDTATERNKNTYRRSYFYRDLEPGGSTVLSPLLVNAPSLPQTQSQIILRTRPCVPSLGPKVDYVVDFGLEGPQTINGAPGGEVVRHNWLNTGSQTLNAYIARDGFSREINSPVTSRTVNIEPPPCTFNGASVASGGSVQAFQSYVVPFGQSCVSEQRVCNKGVLGGSFTASSCFVAPPAGCVLGGVRVAHGASITAYRTSRGLACEPCESEQRTCYNGNLDGYYVNTFCIDSPSDGRQCE